MEFRALRRRLIVRVIKAIVVGVIDGLAISVTLLGLFYLIAAAANKFGPPLGMQ